MPDLSAAPQLAPLFALTPLLVAVALSDLRNLKIPNSYCLAALAIFVLAIPLGMVPDYGLRLVMAGAFLVLGFAAYCLRLFGGGDVKFIAVLLLFVPVHTLTLYGFVFSGAMAVGIAAFLAFKRLPFAARLDWRSMAPGRHLPMGVPIAMSGFAHAVVLLNLSQAG